MSYVGKVDLLMAALLGCAQHMAEHQVLEVVLNQLTQQPEEDR